MLLLRLVDEINRGSHFIENIQKAQKLAESLRTSKLDDPSFYNFLLDLINEEEHPTT